MINNISITTRIILTVSLAFLFSFGAIYYVVFQNYKTILLEEESKKIDILLNTILPTVNINLEFSILDNIDTSFIHLVQSNPEIKAIKLIDLHNNVIVKQLNTKNYKNIIVRTKPIVDRITKKTTHYLKMSYSNASYIRAIKKFKTMFIFIGIGFMVFVVLFMLFLIYAFRPFSNIANKLSQIEPENLDSFDMTKMPGKNEISIINNTIIDMMQRIHFYTTHLQEQVKIELKKNTDKEQFMLQQSRLAQVGEMISMIAHQWRQPLASISSTVSTLELKVMMDEYDEKYFSKQLENLSNYSQYLSSTIDDFRNFFKSKDTKQNTTTKEIIEDALKIIQISIENKGIKLNKQYISINQIVTFKNEVQQVVLNLLKNAEDILLEENIENPTIDIIVDSNEQMDTISIIDNAGGVPLDIIDKIFDPYFTTKDKKDGTGLGLYMSKRIIENRCNGSLEVKNEENKAHFIIMLPKG